MSRMELFEKSYVGLQGCELCGGTGLMPVEDRRGYGSMARCNCYHKARVTPMVILAGIPPKWRESEIKGMQFVTDNEKRALSHLRKWHTEFKPGDNGLFLHGPEGTGKTRILTALAILLIQRRPMGSANPLQPFYWTAIDFLGQVKDTFDHPLEEAEDPLYKAKTCQVLFLDDLGAERETPWGVGVIVEVIDARYNRGLTTIISSNLTLEAIGRRYDARVAGRIREMTTLLILDGESRRVEVPA